MGERPREPADTHRFAGEVLHPPAPVRRAQPEEVPQLAQVLARAFENDPFLRWLVLADERRQAHMAAVFELALRHLSGELSETFTTDGLEGAALWKAPGDFKVPLAKQLQLVPSFARTSGWRHIPAIVRLLHHMERQHEQLVPEPHFYLFALGIEPKLQRRGLGRRLMEPILGRCDADRVPAFLETALPENVPYYQQHGFRLVHVIQRPGWPQFWMMLRPAGG
jgi:ribosomal protein S18 acetylase RimI-like enzyme